MTRAAAATALAAMALIAIAWAIVTALAGGLSFSIAGIRVTSTTPWRPLLFGVIAGVGAFTLTGRERTRQLARRLEAMLSPAILAVTLAAATVVTGLAWNSWTASGPDSFAYVSQAALWRSGRLEAPVPLAADAPWPDAVASFAPFGYRPAPDGRPALVPVTAPGLPLLMAAAQAVAGHSAAFVLTPLFGGVLVLATFAIGRRLRSPRAGLIAAWLVATSPAVLFMLMWPMTDVPAAAFAGVLILLLLHRSPAAAASAGLVAAAGLLVRPNFFLIASGAGAWLLVIACTTDAPRRWSRVTWYAAAALPGVFFLAWLNTRWYGSPAASGYGTAAQLFALSRVGVNVARYGTWLLAASPLAIAGVIALLLPTARVWSLASRPAAWLLGVIAAAAASIYLVYEPYDAWWYLRFLLPAWPSLFVATAVLLTSVAGTSRAGARAIAAIVLASGVYGVMYAKTHGVFETGATERRYVTVARLVDQHTEPSAVILTSAHSGTVRYYAGRVTLRYDVLDPAWLDRAIAWLAARGRHPYILVEDWEAPPFTARYRGASALADLAWSPVVAWQSPHVAGWVWLYDPLRRDASTITPVDLERDQPRAAPPAAVWPQ